MHHGSCQNDESGWLHLAQKPRRRIDFAKFMDLPLSTTLTLVPNNIGPGAQTTCGSVWTGLDAEVPSVDKRTKSMYLYRSIFKDFG